MSPFLFFLPLLSAFSVVVVVFRARILSLFSHCLSLLSRPHPQLYETDPATAGPLGKLAALVTSPFLKTPEQGAQTSIYLSSSPEVEGVSGKYFVDSSPRASNPASYDLDTARKLWEVTKEMVGVDPDAAIAASEGKAVKSKKAASGVAAV